MPKLAEIVKVKGGYANFVQLRSAFQENTENTDRMAMYRPTKARGIATDQVTEFAEAERRLAEWEDAAKTKKGVRDFYADSVKALAQVSPGTLQRQGQDPVVCGGARDQQRSAGCCEAQFRGSEENGQGVATRPQRLSDCSKSAGRP